MSEILAIDPGPERALLRAWIPGEPVAQGRGRAVRTPMGVRVVDPVKSRVWKGVAQVHLQAAMAAAGHTGPFRGALALHVVCLYGCPKGEQRRTAVPMRWRPKRPDADNLGKCLMDACNGLVFEDDSQVVDLRVFKVVAAQGTAPGVSVVVSPAGDVAEALL